MNKISKVDEILKQAQAWLGLKESDGTHKQIIDVYNSHKPLARGYKVKSDDDWCAVFISALAIKCDAVNVVPLECSCGEMIKLAKTMNIWQENDKIIPDPGDIIMYDWQKKDAWPDHVGIVISVDNNHITVIEGNKSNQVAKRDVAIGADIIRGYIRPRYSNSTSNQLPQKEQTKLNGYDDWIARLQAECNVQGYSNQKVDGLNGPKTLAGCPILKIGAKGKITRLVQERLNSVGFDLNVDGIFKSATSNAVKVFQRNRNLVQDGIVGAKTWSYLLSGDRY